MFKKKGREKQGSIWVVQEDIVRSPASDYYDKLEEALQAFGFGEKIRELSKVYYSDEISKGGRKGIDPEVYFKMLIVGFFENIGSERSIASRCADSIAIRRFLKYELTEATPDHSSLSRIRQRLGTEVYDAAFYIVLKALKEYKLLKGKQLGIDTSVIQANASMRTLVNNKTGESYDEYVKRLAQEDGVDPEDNQAVRNFDRKRKDKKMSNKDWHGPNDPEAKIGPNKQGKMKMIHKTEHTVDMDTGAILKVNVLPGIQSDSEQMAESIIQTRGLINELFGKEKDAQTIKNITGDRGYFNPRELAKLHEESIRTAVNEPRINRKLENMNESDRKAVKSARRTMQSKYGRSINRKRGEYLERSFTHLLDNGGLRFATLSGRENIQKRNIIAAMCCNLSLLMRKLQGFGTPKQVIAGLQTLILSYLHLWINHKRLERSFELHYFQFFIRREIRRTPSSFYQKLAT